MRARVIKDFRFEAAHTLPSLPDDHKCRQMHGHSFKVEIHIEGEVNPEIGWVLIMKNGCFHPLEHCFPMFRLQADTEESLWR